MYLGLLISFVGHTALLAWAMISVQQRPELPDTVTIEATIVTPSEFTRLKQGNPDSKKLEAKAKEEPKPEVSKKEAPKVHVPSLPPPPRSFSTTCSRLNPRRFLIVWRRLRTSSRPSFRGRSMSDHSIAIVGPNMTFRQTPSAREPKGRAWV